MSFANMFARYEKCLGCSFVVDEVDRRRGQIRMGMGMGVLGRRGEDWALDTRLDTGPVTQAEGSLRKAATILNIL